MHNFIENPFTATARINYDKLKSTIFSAVKLLDNVIDINKFPDEIYENYQKSFRTIGVGITGLADALVMLGIKYNSNTARSFVFDLMNFITLNVYKASIELSKERGEFPLLDREKFVESGFIKKHCGCYEEWEQVRDDILKYGIRNGKMMSVAPTGTLSLTFGNNCSSGLEPIFSLEYERKVKMGGQSDDDVKIIPMRDYAYGEWLKVKDDPDCVVDRDVFVTALEMTVDEHVDILSSVAYHADMSCSKTINVPSDYSFEDTKKIYEKCHDLGIKGCTIFRPNPIRQGIMITEKNTNEQLEVDKNDSVELPRGYIADVSDDLIGFKRKLNTGCGSIHLEVYSDESTGEPQETFINIGSGGGCERNYQFISRLMSLALRAGVPIESIIDQAMSIRPCTAYINRTKSKGDTSKGTSCPSAIGYALADLHSKIYNTYVAEDYESEQSDGDGIAVNGAACPECGEELSFEGGCNICKSCGWSKCS